MIRDPSFDRWRDSQCFMNSKEIVAHTVERDGGSMIPNFL